MVAINADCVKVLREKTGAGMMDCKAALTECSGDVGAAVDFLRAKGLSNAGKKADRVAAQGLVAISLDGKKASIIELNSETDFVAKNDKFQTLASNLSSVVLKASETDIEKILKLSYNSSSSVADAIAFGISVIGENIALKRAHISSVKAGCIGSYIHNAVATGIGKIGVLVTLESDADPKKLSELANNLAMHIAAYKPMSLTIEALDKNIIERETAVLKERLVNISQGNSAKKIDEERFVQGGLTKFFAEVVLTEQYFLIDGKKKISIVIQDAEQSLGSKITISSIVRFQVGEDNL